MTVKIPSWTSQIPSYEGIVQPWWPAWLCVLVPWFWPVWGPSRQGLPHGSSWRSPYIFWMSRRPVPDRPSGYQWRVPSRDFLSGSVVPFSGSGLAVCVPGLPAAWRFLKRLDLLRGPTGGPAESGFSPGCLWGEPWRHACMWLGWAGVSWIVYSD